MSKSKEEYYKFSHMAQRSLELIYEQMRRIQNRIPIASLQELNKIQYDKLTGKISEEESSRLTNEIYNKTLTQSELYDMQLWVMMAHYIRQRYSEFLSEAEKKKLEQTIKTIESIERRLTKEKDK